jgi:transcriptional regulator with XRE-family HTH domain
MVALREVLGEVLRSHRMRRGLTLRQVSADARISLGYISEVERGQKEASSELIAALCTALNVPLSQVLGDASEQMLVVEQSGDALPARVSDLPVRNVATPPVVAAA